MLNAMDVSYDTLIPNNVSLSDDRRVLKALEIEGLVQVSGKTVVVLDAR